MMSLLIRMDFLAMYLFKNYNHSTRNDYLTAVNGTTLILQSKTPIPDAKTVSIDGSGKTRKPEPINIVILFMLQESSRELSIHS
ncbi:hypothetical protein Nmel_008257 [Mimus melanotis]